MTNPGSPLIPSDKMTRVTAYTLAIRAINQKLGQVKRRKVRLALNEARDFLANDPAFECERCTPVRTANPEGS